MEFVIVTLATLEKIVNVTKTHHNHSTLLTAHRTKTTQLCVLDWEYADVVNVNVTKEAIEKRKFSESFAIVITTLVNASMANSAHTKVRVNVVASAIVKLDGLETLVSVLTVTPLVLNPTATI